MAGRDLAVHRARRRRTGAGGSPVALALVLVLAALLGAACTGPAETATVGRPTGGTGVGDARGAAHRRVPGAEDEDRVEHAAGSVLLAADDADDTDDATTMPATSTTTAGGVSTTRPSTSTTTTTAPTTPAVLGPRPLTPGAKVGGGGILPPPGPGSVTGHVTDAVVHTPLAHVRVWLLDGVGSLAGSTETAADGGFAFSSVAQASYKVSFQDTTATHASIFYPDAPDEAEGAAVAVGTRALTLDAHLYPDPLVPLRPYTGAATGRRLAVIGDSLVQTSTLVMTQTLEPLGLTSVLGLNGQRMDQMQPIATRFAATRPTTVVIALGTNDIDQAWSADATIRALETMIATFDAAACVVVVNVNAHTASWDFNVRAAALDARYAAEVALTPRLRLVDWSARSAALQQQAPAETWFTDGVHLTAAGRTEYANAIRDAAATCPRPAS